MRQVSKSRFLLAAGKFGGGDVVYYGVNIGEKMERDFPCHNLQYMHWRGLGSGLQKRKKDEPPKSTNPMTKRHWMGREGHCYRGVPDWPNEWCNAVYFC